MKKLGFYYVLLILLVNMHGLFLKNNITIANDFQKILDNSTELYSMRKPNKVWVDKGSEFYDKFFKQWLKDNDIEMYSTHNEETYVVTERFIRTLKNKIYKHMTDVWKNVYIDKLDDIVNEYNNAYHSTIKKQLIEVEYIEVEYIGCIREVYDKEPKFKVGGDHVRLSECKNIFAKRHTPNCPEEVFVIKEVKNTAPWTLSLMISMLKKLLEYFEKKKYKKQINKDLG